MADPRADAAGFDPAAFVREILVNGVVIERTHLNAGAYNVKMLAAVELYTARLRPHLRDAAGDDGERVTKAWLRSVGFRQTDFDGYCDTCMVLDNLQYHKPGHWQIGQTRIQNLPTRGHVRRLLAALGVPLEATGG